MTISIVNYVSRITEEYVSGAFGGLALTEPTRGNRRKACPQCHIYLPWRNNYSGPRPPRCHGFKITVRHTTLGKTPLDE
jgi:hypothetical protein